MDNLINLNKCFEHNNGNFSKLIIVDWILQTKWLREALNHRMSWSSYIIFICLLMMMLNKSPLNC